MIITKQEVLMIHAHDHNLQVVFVVLVLLFFLCCRVMRGAMRMEVGQAAHEL